MKNYFFLPLVFMTLFTIEINSQNHVNLFTHVDSIMYFLKNKEIPTVFVAAHRGDWLNVPENSVQGLLNCINLGIDIVEIDLKRTKDGFLVLMHDPSIDRTTTGKGNVLDFTLNELKKLKLRDHAGNPTEYTIPTFNEILGHAKGKIVIDIDKGYEYYNDVMNILKQTGTLNQVLFNIYNTPFNKVFEEHTDFPDDLIVMPIVDLKKTDALSIANSYKSQKNCIYQFVLQSDTDHIINQYPYFGSFGLGIWVNSLKPGFKDKCFDDMAINKGKKEESWGWLVEKGARFIQTDYPKQLLEYLKSKKTHF
jgi:glycerophosphoryl diester phosphodiesterase